jgi:hypothetical protein
MLGGKSMIFHALKVCWKWSRLKKFKKEGDQTQFPQLFLTDMTRKDLEYIL